MQEGVLVVHHTVIKPDEMIFVDGMTMPQIELVDLKLRWNEEIRVQFENGSLVAKIYGIRWQIAPGNDVLLQDLGVVSNRVFVIPGVVTVKINTVDWPQNGTLYLRPRVHRYHLVLTGSTGPDQMTSHTGWNISDLRAALNGTDTWITMPRRPTSTGTGTHGNDDGMDTESDAPFLSAFDPTNMRGGDGLPAAPIGLNTGPDRVLVHLNYSELDNGTLGELNQIFEWVGDSSTIGSWQRYA